MDKCWCFIHKMETSMKYERGRSLIENPVWALGVYVWTVCIDETVLYVCINED